MKLALIIATCLALGILLPVTADDGWTVIDEQTVLENGRIITLDRPPSAPAAEQPGAMRGIGPALERGVGDGYVACSISDDVYPFSLTGLTAGTAINLPGSLNYAYDATELPSGSEVWIADASDTSVIVVDRSTDTVTHQIPVGEYAVSLAFSKNESFALVSCRDNTAGVDNMYRVSTST